jgi:hypothetical protein
MTDREKIIDAAKDCGIKTDWIHKVPELPDFLEAFYHTAQAEALEQAAALIDGRHWTVNSGRNFAEAIRALKEK